MTYHRGLGLPPARQWGELVAKDGWRYRITDDDVLWAARAAECEGGGTQSEKAVLWTWSARYALPRFRSYSSLAALIRAHSQPVNPRWVRGGEMCGPGGRYENNERACSEAQFVNREQCASRSWDAISPSVRDAVEKWATASLSNPVPRAIDFASSTIGKPEGDEEVARFRSGPGRAYNVFYNNADSRRLPADFLHVVLDSRTAGPGAGSLLIPMTAVGVSLVAVAGGLAGWAWWRSRRRGRVAL